MTKTKMRPPLVGITGTNGKTSTIILLSYILKRLGYRPAVMETWQGAAAFERFRQNSRAENADCLIVEVPLDALRQHHLTGGMFDCAALTNLSADHLVSSGTLEHYHQQKLRFFAELPSQAKAVIPADDPAALALSEEVDSRLVSYALDYPHAMVTAKHQRYSIRGSAFSLALQAGLATLSGRAVDPDTVSIDVPVPGRHNAANALLALSVALVITGDLQGLAGSLKQFGGIPRNMEPLFGHSVRILDDGARNPAAIQAALAAAGDARSQAIHILHGIYGGGGLTINRCNAAALAAFTKKNPGGNLFVTRSMYHCKNRHQVSPGEEKAFLAELRSQQVDFYYYPDLPDACEGILSHAGPEDMIIMLGWHTLSKARDVMLRVIGRQKGCSISDALERGPGHELHPGQPMVINPT